MGLLAKLVAQFAVAVQKEMRAIGDERIDLSNCELERAESDDMAGQTVFGFRKPR